MSRYRGIVFDYNGTMFWDNDFHIAAWMTFAERFGRSMTRETYLGYFHGLASRESLEKLLDRTIDPETVLAMQEEKEVIYRQMCLDRRDEFKLAPGLTELLDTLVSRGIPRGMATASAESNVNFYIEQLGLGRWFDRYHIVFDDGKIRNKPAPDIYRVAAERLMTPPEELIVVEDSSIGIQAARNAGIGKIIITGDPASVSAVSAIETDCLPIRDFNDFPVDLLW